MGDAYQRAQHEMIANTIKHCDVVICTAAIHGKPSPKLISRDMLRSMKPGSVVVDLATEFGDTRSGWGGNVEVSPIDDQIVVDGITVIGRRRIETRMLVCFLKQMPGSRKLMTQLTGPSRHLSCSP